MDELHYIALQKLSACRFLPGSWEKRFSRDLASKPMEAELSEQQIKWLKKMVYRFRKQIAARDPDFDFDWTFDALDAPNREPGMKIVCGKSHGHKRSEFDQEIYNKYGEMPESIKDWWNR